jgi:NADH dehydrogenase/NADH:ubiquinone reductase (non-electrogenic)
MSLLASGLPKPRVVILGSGWAGNRLARMLSKELYDVTLISPANHFLVTPLLPQTAVGTLEARNVQENVRTIDRLHKYYQAKARTLDVQSQVLECEECITNERPNGHRFRVQFDALVVATGCKTDTFGTPGVLEAEGREVHFLKHIRHAQGIRNRMLECFERAAMPGVEPDERDRLLSFVVVGGGPTSCEFTAELHDFLSTDVSKWAYPDLAKHVKLTLVEAGPRLMPAFDAALVEHMMTQLATRDVDVRIGTRVKALKADDDGCTNMAVLQAEGGPEETLRFGTLVWSAGLQQVKFVQNLNLRGLELLKGRTGRLCTDEYMRVLYEEEDDEDQPEPPEESDAEAHAQWLLDQLPKPILGGRVYALGDCAEIMTQPLPPTAQVAEQQADYLANCLNQAPFVGLAAPDYTGLAPLPLPQPVPPSSFPPVPSVFYRKSPGFQYINRGSMSSLGMGGGLVDMTKLNVPAPGGDGKPSQVRGPAVTGLLAFTAWHGYYFSRQYTSMNIVLNLLHSFRSRFLRRDIGRF